MEAQYALQKKKALIPLMLVHGYEADGWLGLLLGTSMWYGFYDEALSSSSAFEGRVDALCREIGDRGRADAPRRPAAPALGEDAETTSALVAELQPLKLTALRKRALSEGVATDVVQVAMDVDDAKEALRALILEVERSRGPRDRIRTCLLAGGEQAAEMMAEMLEHAIEVTDQHTASSPRKARKALVHLLERLEAASESIDVDWCDKLSGCDENVLDELCIALASCEGMTVSSPELSTRATEVVECLGRLGLPAGPGAPAEA
jgi:hypothetical protein